MAWAEKQGVIWHLGLGWLLMALGAVTVMAFFFGSALHAIMLDDGFGPVGNMLLFIAGFFGAIYLVNRWGISTGQLGHACTVGIGGAFVLIATLALFKAAITRLAR